MQVIATESEEADKVKSVVSQEEAAASKEAAGVKAIKVCTVSPHARPSAACVACPTRSRIKLFEQAVKVCPTKTELS